jgi:D-lactate dehydrogenase (cytochrome)
MSRAEAFAEIAVVLGSRFSLLMADRDQHSHSEAWFPPALPEAVAFPECTDEVAAILAICSRHQCPVVAWGAGTSLEGHALATSGGLVVDMSRMNRVLKVVPGDMLAVVQPGMTREALNADLRATGLFFPVDPGANASLGGMAATRASGTTAVRYGTMRDNVRALEVVLADGRIIRTGTGAVKSSAGYDLTGLIVGAEGTLGIITELTLRLHGQPEAVAAAVCTFDDLGAAVDTVIATIQSGIPMARIEFVDEAVARAFNVHDGAKMPEKPHLLVEFHGSDAGVAEQSARFGEIVANMGGAHFDWATTTEARNALWRMRHRAYPSCLALRPDAMGLLTDVCVPISRLAEAVQAAREDIAAAGLIGPMLGHAGDGNFHAVLLLDRDDPEEFARARNVARRMAERALAVGGTITGEHGIGIGKKGLMASAHGEAWAVMADMKRVLDPQNILNPGNVVEVLP